MPSLEIAYIPESQDNQEFWCELIVMSSFGVWHAVLAGRSIVNLRPTVNETDAIKQHHSLGVQASSRPSVVEHQPFSVRTLNDRAVTWSFPTFGSKWRSGFENGIIGVFGVWAECAGCSRHSNSIAIVVVAAPAVEEIVVAALLHEPLPFDNPSLPNLVVLHEQLRASTSAHACWIQQNCPKFSWMSVCVSIHLVNNIIVDSLSQNSRIDDSLRSIGDQRSAFVSIRSKDVIWNGSSDRQSSWLVSGGEIDDELFIDDMQFWRPIVAASGPRSCGGEHPSNLSEVCSGCALPDGEIMTVPAHCCDCVVSAIVVDDSWIGWVTHALHWICVTEWKGYKREQEYLLYHVWFIMDLTWNSYMQAI